MREIKFRGQRVDNKEWAYGYFYINDKGKNMIHNPNAIPRHFRVIPETVGQYTGLKDKNGVEIYEGDVIIYRNMMFTIEWQEDDGRFLGIEKNKNRPAGQNYICYVGEELSTSEVIGNIHDNAELMEVNKDGLPIQKRN